MVILRIASIHGASYEFAAHEPFGLREGLTPTQIEALKTGDLHAFDAKERAILTYCESITHEIHMPDAVLNSAKEHFSESEMVERSEERRVGKERRSRWPRAEERRRGERANTRGAAASATWTRGR